MDLYTQISNCAISIDRLSAPILNETIEISSNWMMKLFKITDTGDNSFFNNCHTNEDKTSFIQDNLVKLYNVNTGKLMTPGGVYDAGWFISPTVGEIKRISRRTKLGTPIIKIVQGVDVGKAHILASYFESFQGAGQFNALEMMKPSVTWLDGIFNYIYDNTQGPRTALSCAPGTFVRNYCLPQFNALEKLNIQPQNGYLLWDSHPESILSKIENNSDNIMIPAMIYTQVAGITKSNCLGKHILDKRVHQIYASGVPVEAYNNKGNYDTQLEIAKTILLAEYIGTIGLSLILHDIDVKAGLTKLDRPKINLTLVGAGVFNVPLLTVIDVINEAIAHFGDKDCEIMIHGFSSFEADTLRQHIKILN